MKWPKPDLPDSHLKYLYTTSLLSVLAILFLFIFFLPMFSVPSGLTVLLPKVLTPESLSKPCFVVTILGNGDLYLDNKKISIQALKQFLNSQHGGQYQVLIKIDRDCRVKALVDVWGLARQAGASVVHMATNE